jgi:hypothetical protein
MPEKRPQVVVTTHALAVDEGLGRRLDTMRLLEGFRLLMRLQVMTLNFVTVPLEQIQRLRAVGTVVLRHDHAVKHSPFRFTRGAQRCHRRPLPSTARVDRRPVDGRCL